MDSTTYIFILKDILIKKDNLLDKLIKITQNQQDILINLDENIEEFDECITEKEILIERLNQLDDGFEKVYEGVKNEIASNTINHKVEIIKIQELIKQITQKSIKLQMLEKQNRSKIEMYFNKQKKEIKNYKTSNQAANSYYKSMNQQYHDESFFLDKKN